DLRCGDCRRLARVPCISAAPDERDDRTAVEIDSDGQSACRSIRSVVMKTRPMIDTISSARSAPSFESTQLAEYLWIVEQHHALSVHGCRFGRGFPCTTSVIPR